MTKIARWRVLTSSKCDKINFFIVRLDKNVVQLIINFRKHHVSLFWFAQMNSCWSISLWHWILFREALQDSTILVFLNLKLSWECLSRPGAQCPSFAFYMITKLHMSWLGDSELSTYVALQFSSTIQEGRNETNSFGMCRPVGIQLPPLHKWSSNTMKEEHVGTTREPAELLSVV